MPFRTVHDLTALGGAGAHRLHFTRFGHSRLIGGPRNFGDGHIWRHNYQWEMVSTGTGSLRLTYPEGTNTPFSLSGGVWKGIASNPDVLTQSGNQYYLRRRDNTILHFEKLTVSGQTYYQLQDFSDGMGVSYACSYDANRNLILVSEPAGRWLRISYQSIPLNQSQFTTLATVTATPPAGQWVEQTVTNTGSYRYLRYYSTDPEGQESFCNVAEIEFYNQSGVKLTGTPFGTSPSYQNKTDRTFDKATDGNTATYFDFAYKHFGFTGIDLGVGNTARISKVRYFARAGFEGRMPGGRFEGANSAPVTQTVIAKVEIGTGSGVSEVVQRAVNFRYVSKPDPLLATGWLTLAGVDYGDGASASYNYQVLWPGQRPLLESTDDPRVEGKAPQIRYEFWTNAYVVGAIYAERHAGSGQILAKFEGRGSNNYSNMGRTVTYASGAAAQVDMGPDNTVVRRTSPAGRVTEYSYSMVGNQTAFVSSKTIKDVSGSVIATVNYQRDAQGRLTSVSRSGGVGRSYAWDSAGFVLSRVNENGWTTTFGRDSNHRLTSMSKGDGTVELFTYNGLGKVVDHKFPNGEYEHFTYDGAGRVSIHTDAAGQITTYTYNALDQVIAVTDPLLHTTNYEYNERGQVTKVTFPGGAYVSAGYDAYGRTISVTNEGNKTWSFEYDEFRRRTAVTDPMGNTTRYGYDLPGSGGAPCCTGGTPGATRPTSVTLPSLKTVQYTYDLANRITTITQAPGTADQAVTQYFYDDATHAHTIDARGKTWSFTYDARKRRTGMTDPLGRTTSWTYDGMGNMLTVTRPLPDGGTTVMTYDAQRRLTSVKDEKNKLTQYFYGGKAFGDGTKGGNLVKLVDAAGHATLWNYDQMNRRVRKTYADASHDDWSYDAAGRLTTVTKAGGQILTVAYDDRNRPTSRTWSDGTPAVSIGYDTAGRLGTLSSSVSALSYTYDDANHLLSETQDLNAPLDLAPLTVGYSYDVDGNRSGMAYPGGGTVSYGYTARNQVSAITAGTPPPLATFSYDAGGRRTGKTLENGTSAAYSYDDAARLTGIAHKTGAATFLRQLYGYNSVDNIVSRGEQVGTAATGYDVYGYDAIGQLTGVQYGVANPAAPATPTRTASFSYDAAGNRTSVIDSANNGGAVVPYTANALNQYTAIDGLVLPTYDANGNLSRVQTKLGQSVWNYSYDAQNRLTGGTSSNGDTFTFTYDAWGRCVARTISGATLLYVWDGWRLVSEREVSGTEQARYIFGTVMDESLCRITPTGASYYHQDKLGSTVAITDSTGVLIERNTYGGYGAPTFFDASGSASTGSLSGNRLLFTGREWLAPLELNDHRNRIYSPEIGRWLSRDPIGEIGGINLYAYGRNSPTTLLDPLGLCTLQIGLTVNVQWGPVNFNVFAGFAFDGHGGIGGYYGGGAGVGVGAGATGGLSFAGSNGDTIEDLGGPFGSFNAGLGAGAGASGDVFWGSGSQGQPIMGGGFTVGGGLGGGGALGATETDISRWR